jgi:3-deoxy-D-manno-octulosonic-acid transferase
MIHVYRVVAYLVYVIIYPYGRIRALQGDKLWKGRLGIDRLKAADLWIHAASVGEVRVVSYLIDFILRARPGIRVHLTVVTRAGYETAGSICSDKVEVSFFPLDVPFLQRAEVTELSPRALVMAETELWPNLILEAGRAGVPVILINGRMSERAQRRYLWFRRSFQKLLATYDHFFYKTDDDARRYAEFGVTADRGTIAGDMKFDAPLVERDAAAIHGMRSRMGVSDEAYVFVAGSTRPGEEALLLQVYQSLRGSYPNLRMIIAPRHLDRVSEIVDLFVLRGISTYRFNTNGEMKNFPVSAGSESVIIIDQMGILNDLYLAADLAFVGGTLVEVGGHNILEPVWAGTPVLFGPSINNVKDAAEYILANSYGAQVADAEDLERTLGEAISHRRSFHTKTVIDFQNSATAIAGSYILKIISHV